VEEKVIIALHDQFTGTTIRDFILRHDWHPRTEFHVAHVLELPAPARPGDPAWDLGLQRAWQTASSLTGAFAELIKHCSPDTHVKEHILQGRAADELVRLAQDQAASLIIMGCRGRRGWRRLLLGSVSGTVANKAPCSVVILKKNHLAFARRKQA